MSKVQAKYLALQALGVHESLICRSSDKICPSRPQTCGKTRPCPVLKLKIAVKSKKKTILEAA
jgi:hypothetical protein